MLKRRKQAYEGKEMKNKERKSGNKHENYLIEDKREEGKRQMKRD